MNFRKQIILFLLRLKENEVVKTLNFIRSIEHKSSQEIKAIQKHKLEKLLLHAHKNVPYYTKILEEADVVNGNIVNLDNFDKIPILTKDIIRTRFEELKSIDINKRDWYLNTSGGSTGVPVKLVQDKLFWSRALATKIYFSLLAGKDIGQKEIQLWGSERDVLKGTIGFKAKVQNFIMNKVFLNSFLMSERNMKLYVKIWNKFRPVSVWAYVDSIYTFAKFIDENKIIIWSPKSIIVTAGTLHEDVRIFVERVFKCKVINQYGSREVSDIAAECINQEGLHVFEYAQYIEVLDDNLNPVADGEVGNLYVTNLNNYSMPLIRYDIGDLVRITNKKCSCGRGFSMLAEVTGRVTDHFRKKDGTLVHGEFFTHLFYFKKWVKKFQVVQQSYNLVKVYIILCDKQNKKDMADIEYRIKAVMEQSCKVCFVFVNEIPLSKSGKFLYTKCLINAKRGVVTNG